MLRFGHIELFVASIEASRRFYLHVLGFDLVANQGDDFVWLKAGGTEILLRPAQGRPAAAPRYAESAQGIVLYTDNLAAAVAELKSRGLDFDGFDGSDRCPTFRDPDGHWFQLVAQE